MLELSWFWIVFIVVYILGIMISAVQKNSDGLGCSTFLCICMGIGKLLSMI